MRVGDEHSTTCATWLEAMSEAGAALGAGTPVYGEVHRLRRRRDELAKTLSKSFDVLNKCHDIIGADCDEAADRWLLTHLEIIRIVLDSAAEAERARGPSDE